MVLSPESLNPSFRKSSFSITKAPYTTKHPGNNQIKSSWLYSGIKSLTCTAGFYVPCRAIDLMPTTVQIWNFPGINIEVEC